MAIALMWSVLAILHIEVAGLPIVLGRSIEHALPNGDPTTEGMTILARRMGRSLRMAVAAAPPICVLVLRNTQRGSIDTPAIGLKAKRVKTMSALALPGMARSQQHQLPLQRRPLRIPLMHPTAPDFIGGLGILKGGTVMGKSDIVPIEVAEEAMVTHHDQLTPKLQAQAIDPDIADQDVGLPDAKDAIVISWSSTCLTIGLEARIVRIPTACGRVATPVL